LKMWQKNKIQEIFTGGVITKSATIDLPN